MTKPKFDIEEATSAIELAANEFRERMKLNTDSYVEVLLPHWRHEQYLKHYGSQEALDEQFGPRVKLVCQSCLQIAERAVEKLRSRGWVR